jgi:cytochrome c-type biogenesis protein CcmF
MIVEIGHFALILAFVLSMVQSVVPVWGAMTRDTRLMSVAQPVAVMMFLLVGISFVALTHAYLTSDFSVLNVIENSHSAKPLLFKLTGVWGNHEGSVLLWVLILVLFGALVAAFGSNIPAELRSLTRSCRTWGWRSIRRSSTSAMSASPSSSPSPSPRCCLAGSMPPGRAGCGRGRCSPGCS